jgi:hypothetical protein
MDQSGISRWYLDAVRLFRAMGFFSRYSQLTDEEMAARVYGDVCRDWDEPFPSAAERDPQLADMYLLATDKERVWQADLECVYPGEHAYVRFLEGLAAISRGAFTPQSMFENWHGERGPVDVEFTAGETIYHFTHDGGDMLDPSILRTINRSIASAAIAFEACDNFGMPNFIVALTPDEKARLTARGWKFWQGR